MRPDGRRTGGSQASVPGRGRLAVDYGKESRRTRLRRNAYPVETRAVRQEVVRSGLLSVEDSPDPRDLCRLL